MRKAAIALAVVAVLAMSAGSAMAEHGSRHGGRGHGYSAYRAPVYSHGHHSPYHHGGATVYRNYGYPPVYGYGYPPVYRSYRYCAPPSGFYYRSPGFGISIGF
jgi:hypothetical protein